MASVRDWKRKECIESKENKKEEKLMKKKFKMMKEEEKGVNQKAEMEIGKKSLKKKRLIKKKRR